jgi:hypothetical protein
MSEAEQLKKQCLEMAATELELLMSIIGDLGFVGYKISLCKIKGYSYNQCRRKYGISRPQAQRHWKKCREKEYDIHLKRMFNL